MADGKDDPSVSLGGPRRTRRYRRAAASTGVAAVRHFEAAVDVVEKTRSDLLRTEFKLPFLTRLIRLYDEYVNTLIDQKQFDRALAVADSSRAQVLAERYGSAPARRLAPDAFHALARQTNAVLLSYWLGPARSHAWVVTGRRDPPRRTAARRANRTAGERISGGGRAPPRRSAAHPDSRRRAPLPVADRTAPRVDPGQDRASFSRPMARCTASIFESLPLPRRQRPRYLIRT